MDVGSEVVAVGQIVDENVDGSPRLVAEPGEVGRVVEVFPEPFWSAIIAFENGFAECCEGEVSQLVAAPA